MGLFDFLKKKKPKVTATITTHEYTPQELTKQREKEVDEIRELSRRSFPSKNGLRPHEIAMLSHAPHYKTTGNDFPRYWHFDYGIDNPQQVLNMLLENGFIRVATAKESAGSLKIPELKSILSEFAVTAKGKKADLVIAVRESISEEDLNAKIPVRSYALTELGEQELKENEYVAYFGGSSRYGLTVWDMNRLLQGYPHKLFRDKIWANFNQQMQKSAEALQKDGDMYSFYLQEISIHYEMCDFLIEENRHPLDALRIWARAAYYDIMVQSTEKFKMILDLEKYKDGPTVRRVRDPETGKSVLIEDNSPPKFQDELNLSSKIRNVRTLKERLGFSDNELFQNLISFLSECQLVEYGLIRNRNITKLELSYEDIAGLVVAEVNENSEISYTVYENIETQIKRDKSPVWKI